MLILLAACSKTVTATPVSEAAPTPSTWVGAWRSPACGDRSYERNLILRDDHTVTLEDRISPCPEGAMCMWSGVVLTEGTWVPAEGLLKLQLGAPQGAAPAVDLPVELNWKGAPAEGPCVYEAGVFPD